MTTRPADQAPAIRTATPDDLQWLGARPDPAEMAAIKAAEIDSAKTASATPDHWRPVEVDEAQLR